jgi:hypothetical protein
VFPKLVSTLEDVRKASAEAERRIDAHVSMCRFDYLFSFLCTLEKFGAAFIGVREGEAEL